MDETPKQGRRELKSLERDIRAERIGRAQRAWRGAGVVISERRPERVQGGFYPEDRSVVTRFVFELSWLFESLRDIFADVLNGRTKVEFYGRLANAANRHLNRSGDRDRTALLLAVLGRAKSIRVEMEHGQFGFLLIAFGNLIFDDIVEQAAMRLEREQVGIVVSEDALEALLARAAAHRDAVAAEINQGRATPHSIEEAAYLQLRESVDVKALNGFAPGRSVITGRDVKAGMRLRCHWIPWC